MSTATWSRKTGYMITSVGIISLACGCGLLGDYDFDVKPTTGDGGSGAGTSSGGTGGSTPAPITAPQAIQMFGDCMRLADWYETGMEQMATQNCTYNGQNDVKCYSCHDPAFNIVSNKWVATGGVHLPDPNAPNADEQIRHGFGAMRYMYDVLNLVRWTVHPADGSFTGLVPTQYFQNAGVEGGSHPTYQLDPTHVAAYEEWFQRAEDRWRDAWESGVPCVPEELD